MRIFWKKTVSNSEARKRAGGRRHYNAVRQLNAELRRKEMIEKFGSVVIVAGMPGLGWGQLTRIARYFGVHRQTIKRDIERLNETWRRDRICPICGCVYGYNSKLRAKFARFVDWDICFPGWCRRWKKEGGK